MKRQRILAEVKTNLDRKTDRQTVRQTDRKTDRQTHTLPIKYRYHRGV